MTMDHQQFVHLLDSWATGTEEEIRHRKCQNSEKDLPWRSFARYAENNDPSDEE
jgi:hypothetical protein